MLNEHHSDYYKFILFFLAYVVLSFVIKFLATTFEFTSHLHFVIYGAICFALTSRKWNYSKRFCLIFGIVTLLYVSITFLKLINGMILEGTEILDMFVFSTFLFCFCACLYKFFFLFRNRLIAKLGMVVVSIFCLIIFCIPTLFWGYYIISQQLLSADIVLSLFQTNLEEALAYLKGQNMFSWCISFLVLILTIVLNFYLLHRLVHLKVIRSKRFNILLVAYFSFVMYAVFPKTCDFYAFNTIASTKNELQNFQAYGQEKEKRNQRLNQLQSLKISPGGGGVYVLVIGESEAKSHMGIYGYERNTTPWLTEFCEKNNTLLFSHAYSNHTQTVPVLTYALSEKNQYNSIDLVKANSIMELAKAAGYETYWISNQEKWGPWDTPVAEIASTADHQVWINNSTGRATSTQYYDGELINRLPELHKTGNVLIVIHVMGCHGSYIDRYPAGFKEFTGEAADIDAYDDAVLYNDCVLKGIYNKVKDYPDFKAFIYFSDHGEDVDHHIGHESSKFTYTMSRIPLILHFSDMFIQRRSDTFDVLKEHTNNYWTNDLLYNLMVDIMGIQGAPVQEDNLDLASPEYNFDAGKLKTLHGRINISDDPLMDD